MPVVVVTAMSTMPFARAKTSYVTQRDDTETTLTSTTRRKVAAGLKPVDGAAFRAPYS